MECPVCRGQFSEMVIQHHAWDCNGSKLPEEGVLTLEGAAPSALIQGQDYQRPTCTSYFHQPLNEVNSVFSSDPPAVPHSSTEKSHDVAEEARECPVCSYYFPSGQIVEHAAFCNGPSYSHAQEPEIPSYSQALEPEIPSYSQAQEPRVSTEDGSTTMQLFWSYISGNEPVVPGAAAGSEGPRGVLSNRAADAGSVSNLGNALQYLKKLEHRMAQDPEFKQVLEPLLNSPDAFHILQSLLNTIFSGNVTGGAMTAAPVFLFFQLAKLFLPGILRSESFTAFQKWAKVFIVEIVVPWISQMGGWGAVLCALGALLASGLLVGLAMLLKTSNSQK